MKNELLELLNKAKNEVNNHPKGELILPIRKSILKHLGEHLENSNEHALINNGLKRRIKLAVLCVEYVMPIWNEVAPEDTTPQDLIKSIDTYLLGKVEWKTFGTCKIVFGLLWKIILWKQDLRLLLMLVLLQ
jgi:hypothetical protein